MRPLAPLLALLVTATALPVAAAAQTSQFGARGLGLPVRSYSARSLALGGGLALFDAESSLNPAAVGALRSLQALGTSTSSWRDSQNPFGSAFGRDTRFSLIQAGGPVYTNGIGVTKVHAAVSLSAYGDRNFALTSVDSMVLRDELVEVRDTLVSQGGLTDLRVAGAWSISPNLTLGGGLHLITGATRVRSVRVVGGPEYNAVDEVAEVSYLSYGFSAGLVARLSDRVALSGLARIDAPSRVERDTARVATLDLPVTLGAGARVALHSRLLVAGQVVHRGWGAADQSIRELGGIGSRHSLEASGGVEWSTSGTNVTRWPLRLGAHYTSLPFPLQAGGQGRETGLSVGTGIRVGPGGRGGFDLAVERIWRSEGPAWREQVFLLTFGLSVRP